jgi:hypothetical protein
MIRATSKTDLAPLDSLIGFLDNHDEVVRDVGQRVYDEWKPQLLDALQQTPGSVKYPVEWTSEKQRRAYFATNGFGAGIPFQRNGDISNAWEVIDLSVGGNFGILVRNTNPASKFLYGSLARDKMAAMRWRQKFHQNTGWIFARDIVYLYFDIMDKAFMREFIAVATLSSKRRAYTKRSL